MITQDLIDLCKTYVGMTPGERRDIIAPLHDAFCEAGYPYIAKWHISSSLCHTKPEGCKFCNKVLEGFESDLAEEEFVSKQCLNGIV